jgi:hypothetical protein
MILLFLLLSISTLTSLTKKLRMFFLLSVLCTDSNQFIILITDR